MSLRLFRDTVCLIVILSSPSANATDNHPIDPKLVSALRQAVEEEHSFDNSIDALVWLADMSERLKTQITDPFYRISLLKSIHTESTYANLAPALVLAVIQVESSFDRFAVSKTGARGLMQIMPFWKKEIGHPKDDLFYPPTNLRYGCTILRYYIDQFNGDLKKALSQYNGSLYKKSPYAQKVLQAMNVRWQSQDLSLESERAN